MAQTSYSENTDLGFAGMLADTGPKDVLSRSMEEASAVPFGVAVVAGTDKAAQVLLPTGAAKILGVLVHEHKAPVTDAAGAKVESGEMCNVLHSGRICVVVEDAVVAGNAPFIRVVAAGAEQLGAFRSNADTADALLASGMRFITSAGAGEVAIVEIDKNAAIA